MKNNIARPINQLHFSALGCFTRSTTAPFPRLDTYQSERAPHVREFIELAIRLGGLINTKSVEAGLAAGVRRENEPAKLEVKKPLLGPGLSAANTELTAGSAIAWSSIRAARDHCHAVEDEVVPASKRC